MQSRKRVFDIPPLDLRERLQSVKMRTPRKLRRNSICPRPFFQKLQSAKTHPLQFRKAQKIGPLLAGKTLQGRKFALDLRTGFASPFRISEGLKM